MNIPLEAERGNTLVVVVAVANVAAEAHQSLGVGARNRRVLRKHQAEVLHTSTKLVRMKDNSRRNVGQG